MQDRTPPNALMLEQELLGAILLRPALMSQIGELGDNEFYRPAHAVVWRALTELRHAGTEIAISTVAQRMEQNGDLDRVGGVSFLSALVDNCMGAPSLLDHCVKRIRETNIARELQATLSELSDAGFGRADAGEYLREIQERVFRFVVAFQEKRQRSIKHYVREAVKDLESRFGTEAKLAGIASGLPDLDALTCGFEPGSVTILAARSSMGKTALALQLALASARGDHPSLVFSLEMGGKQLAERLLLSETGITSSQWRKATVNPHTVGGAMHRLSGLPLWVDESTAVTATDIRARARQWLAAHGGGKQALVVVDYIGLVKPAESKSRQTTREQEVAAVSRELKALALESQCAVLALAQVSRRAEQREEKRPVLSDLRESGSLEQDADMVLFIFREDYYDPEKNPGVAEVNVAKHRNGPIGTVEVGFDAATMRFRSLNRRQNEC